MQIDIKTHRLQVDGLGVKKPIVLSVDDLKRKFQQVSVSATLQCAGNRRVEMAKFKKVGLERHLFLTLFIPPSEFLNIQINNRRGISILFLIYQQNMQIFALQINKATYYLSRNIFFPDSCPVPCFQRFSFAISQCP